MIQKNTVIILGAGASKPYNFPLGVELRDEIIKIGANDRGLEATFFSQITGFDSGYLYKFTTDLSKSGYSSVDAFLENRPEWIEIGKHTIAHKLFFYEKNAKLFPPEQPKDHWYETLWHNMMAPTWEEFKLNKLQIITFNYDRSLEHYLSTILSNNYNISKEEIIPSLPIIHVHGDLGSYKNYGNHSFENIKFAVSSIKIVHESNNSTKEFKLADKIIENAKSILFIGFGYHIQNLIKFKLFKSYYENPSLALRHQYKNLLGTHRGIKSKAWTKICGRFNFSREAKNQGGGSISEFLSESLDLD